MMMIISIIISFSRSSSYYCCSFFLVQLNYLQRCVNYPLCRHSHYSPSQLACLTCAASKQHSVSWRHCVVHPCRAAKEPNGCNFVLATRVGAAAYLDGCISQGIIDIKP